MVLGAAATGAVAELASIPDKRLANAARLLRLACFQSMPVGCNDDRTTSVPTTMQFPHGAANAIFRCRRCCCWQAVAGAVAGAGRWAGGHAGRHRQTDSLDGVCTGERKIKVGI